MNYDQKLCLFSWELNKKKLVNSRAPRCATSTRKSWRKLISWRSDADRWNTTHLNSFISAGPLLVIRRQLAFQLALYFYLLRDWSRFCFDTSASLNSPLYIAQPFNFDLILYYQIWVYGCPFVWILLLCFLVRLFFSTSVPAGAVCEFKWLQLACIPPDEN